MTEGIATGRVEYFNGCEKFLIQPPVDKDGKDQDALWLDIQELQVVEPQAVPRPEVPTAEDGAAVRRVGGSKLPSGMKSPGDRPPRRI